MAAGLQLRSGFNVGGNYSPMTPASAASPTSNTGSIGQMAYGISGTGEPSDKSVAGYGSVAVGVFALAALAYLWWSLPR